MLFSVLVSVVTIITYALILPYSWKLLLACSERIKFKALFLSYVFPVLLGSTALFLFVCKLIVSISEYIPDKLVICIMTALFLCVVNILVVLCNLMKPEYRWRFRYLNYIFEIPVRGVVESIVRWVLVLVMVVTILMACKTVPVLFTVPLFCMIALLKLYMFALDMEYLIFISSKNYPMFRNVLDLPNSNDLLLNQETCAICLLDNSFDSVCGMHCFHLYHFECIHVWFAKSNKCPICRTEL